MSLATTCWLCPRDSSAGFQVPLVTYNQRLVMGSEQGGQQQQRVRSWDPSAEAQQQQRPQHSSDVQS